MQKTESCAVGHRTDSRFRDDSYEIVRKQLERNIALEHTAAAYKGAFRDDYRLFEVSRCNRAYGNPVHRLR